IHVSNSLANSIISKRKKKKKRLRFKHIYTLCLLHERRKTFVLLLSLLRRIKTRMTKHTFIEPNFIPPRHRHQIAKPLVVQGDEEQYFKQTLRHRSFSNLMCNFVSNNLRYRFKFFSHSKRLLQNKHHTNLETKQLCQFKIEFQISKLKSLRA